MSGMGLSFLKSNQYFFTEPNGEGGWGSTWGRWGGIGGGCNKKQNVAGADLMTRFSLSPANTHTDATYGPHSLAFLCLLSYLSPLTLCHHRPVLDSSRAAPQ